MPRFFVEQPIGSICTLTGENAEHISRSLRMRVGDEIVLCDGQGSDYAASITRIGKNEVEAAVTSCQPCINEPHTKVTLYQCFPKGSKLETVTQKAVELGVYAIVPVQSVRCVSRPDDKSADRKRERLQKIALEAAKQCGRGIIPTVHHVVPFDEAVKRLSAHACPIMFYEGGGAPLGSLLTAECTDVGILIGPEGGFADCEAAAAKALGIPAATLGPRILRTETAPIAALSVTMYITKNMECKIYALVKP